MQIYQSPKAEHPAGATAKCFLTVENPEYLILQVDNLELGKHSKTPLI
jgi:hypothetical protein